MKPYVRLTAAQRLVLRDAWLIAPRGKRRALAAMFGISYTTAYKLAAQDWRAPRQPGPAPGSASAHRTTARMRAAKQRNKAHPITAGS